MSKKQIAQEMLTTSCGSKFFAMCEFLQAISSDVEWHFVGNILYGCLIEKEKNIVATVSFCFDNGFENFSDPFRMDLKILVKARVNLNKNAPLSFEVDCKKNVLIVSKVLNNVSSFFSVPIFYSKSDKLFPQIQHSQKPIEINSADFADMCRELNGKNSIELKITSDTFYLSNSHSQFVTQVHHDFSRNVQVQFRPGILNMWKKSMCQVADKIQISSADSLVCFSLQDDKCKLNICFKGDSKNLNSTLIEN